MQSALDELRGELGTDRIELGELVILGANLKLAELRAQQEGRATLRQRAADRIREGRPLPIDREAAEEVRRTGWARQ